MLFDTVRPQRPSQWLTEPKAGDMVHASDPFGWFQPGHSTTPEQAAGVPLDISIIKFPEFHKPGSMPELPEITESCMTNYLSPAQRDEFMCNGSKMVVKQEGECKVYACTLVDDDKAYDLGKNLKQAMDVRVMLKHHRCYSCFSYGASCSEG